MSKNGLPLHERDSKGNDSLKVISVPLGIVLGALLSVLVGMRFPESVPQILVVFALGSFVGALLIQKILNKIA